MKALFALVMIMSAPDGSQVETIGAPALTFAQCDHAQRAIWELPFETVFVDAEGAHIPSVDAYCAPVDAATLPACADEDSENCLWNAQERGNGQGNSFFNDHGAIYPLD